MNKKNKSGKKWFLFTNKLNLWSFDNFIKEEEEEEEEEEEQEEDATDRMRNDLNEVYDNDTNKLAAVQVRLS